MLPIWCKTEFIKRTVKATLRKENIPGGRVWASQGRVTLMNLYNGQAGSLLLSPKASKTSFLPPALDITPRWNDVYNKVKSKDDSLL